MTLRTLCPERIDYYSFFWNSVSSEMTLFDNDVISNLMFWLSKAQTEIFGLKSVIITAL